MSMKLRPVVFALYLQDSQAQQKKEVWEEQGGRLSLAENSPRASQNANHLVASEHIFAFQTFFRISAFKCK